MVDRRTANLLGALGIALADRQWAAAADTGLAAADAIALNAIGQAPGSSIEAVRVTLDFSHPGTVRVIDRLVAAGLVERRPGVDGRTRGLVLTDRGRDVWQRQNEQRTASLATVAAVLSAEQLGQLTPIVERLLGAMTTTDAEAEHLCRLCDERVCPQRRCPVTTSAG